MGKYLDQITVELPIQEDCVVTYKVFEEDNYGRKLVKPVIRVSINGSSFAIINPKLLEYTKEIYDKQE